MKVCLWAGTVLMMLAGTNRIVLAQAAATGHAEVTQNVVPADKGAQPSAKQLALQAQIDRLVSMATDLSGQVDKTNKNILSIKVVRKAEEIELFAKRMKEENRK